MFLIERIVSLLVYAFVLFTTYGLLKRVVRSQWKAVLLLYLVALCIFAFNYKPYVTADLYRLRQYITYWTELPFSRLVSYALQHSAPAWVFYSYFINKLGNINWLQTVTCFWCFGNVFYIISHEIQRNDLIKKQRSLLLFYIMAVGAFYLQTISGIRSMLGISIVAYCFYRETIENKSILVHLPLYLFAALLHSAAMPLVISRFVFLVIQYKSVSKKLLFSMLVLGLGAFSINYLQDYISEALNVGQGYLFGKQEYTYIWEIIIGLIEMFITWYVMGQYKKRYAGNEGMASYNSMRLFCLAWSVISVVALPFSYAVFRRYTMFCTLQSIPLLAKILQYEQDRVNKSTFITNIWFLLMIVFAISGIRGDLCGYKFFVL